MYWSRQYLLIYPKTRFATPTLTPKAAHKLKKIVNMQTSKNRKYDIKEYLGNYQSKNLGFQI